MYSQLIGCIKLICPIKNNLYIKYNLILYDEYIIINLFNSH